MCNGAVVLAPTAPACCRCLLHLSVLSLLRLQVWQGQVQGKSFQHFTTKQCSSDSEGKAALQKAGYSVTVMKDRNLKDMKDDVRNFTATAPPACS